MCAYSHEAFARDARLRFPLLADFQTRGAVARRYGVDDALTTLESLRPYLEGMRQGGA